MTNYILTTLQQCSLHSTYTAITSSSNFHAVSPKDNKDQLCPRLCVASQCCKQSWTLIMINYRDGHRRTKLTTLVTIDVPWKRA